MPFTGYTSVVTLGSEKACFFINKFINVGTIWRRSLQTSKMYHQKNLGRFTNFDAVVKNLAQLIPTQPIGKAIIE